jgi:Zn-dependent peptidase ImmA (M78 family)
MPARLPLARKKARQVLKECNVRKAPVAVEHIATLVGATLRYEPYAGELSGMLHRKEGGAAIIGINSVHPRTRQRFTIAHELGHLVLHKEQRLHVDSRFPIALRSELSSLAIDDGEIEANQFAAELLMPIEFLEKDIRRIPDELALDEAIKRLAAQYEVSAQAMTIRLSSLGLLS